MAAHVLPMFDARLEGQEDWTARCVALLSNMLEDILKGLSMYKFRTSLRLSSAVRLIFSVKCCWPSSRSATVHCLSRSNALALIDNRHNGVTIIAPDNDADCAALWRIADRVADKVGDDLKRPAVFACRRNDYVFTRDLDPHFGLPGETRAMMLETARYLSLLPVSGVKIHLLYVVKGTKMADLYSRGAYKCLSREECINLVIDFIELLPPGMVIQRLTGDPPPSELLAPDWAREKAVRHCPNQDEAGGERYVAGEKAPSFPDESLSSLR